MLQGRKESEGAKGWIMFHRQVESSWFLNIVKFISKEKEANAAKK